MLMIIVPHTHSHRRLLSEANETVWFSSVESHHHKSINNCTSHTGHSQVNTTRHSLVTHMCYIIIISSVQFNIHLYSASTNVSNALP